jgi:two-component system KDP operon response regulator KdpE
MQPVSELTGGALQAATLSIEMCAMRAPDKGSPTALLVEDDPAVARMLRIFLRASGFEITEAAQGAEALKVLERESPDTVILDLMLPNGQGGSVLDWLRGKGQHEAPAWVVISALDREEATARYGPLGNHFLGKPFDPMVLLAMLRTPLSAGEGGQPEAGARKQEGTTTARGGRSSRIARGDPRRGGKTTRLLVDKEEA